MNSVGLGRASVVVALGFAVCVGASDARADDKPGFLQRIYTEALTTMAAVGSPEPLTPIAVQWKAERLTSFELAAPVLAVAAHDFEGDRRVEIVLLTTTEVIVGRLASKRKFTVVARSSLPRTPATRRSRDPIGALAIALATETGTSAQILARTSEQGAGVRLSFAAGKLKVVGQLSSFPICDRLSAQPAPGRNYFDASTAVWDPPLVREFSLPTSFAAVSCRRLRGARGHEVGAIASVSADGAVSLHCERSAGSACDPETVPASIGGQGDVVAILDANNDGRAELLTTRGKMPGASDRVRVFTHEEGETKKIYERRFVGAIVAVTSADIDTDGVVEAIVVVTGVNAGRISLWSLN